MKPHHTRYQHEQFCITNCFWAVKATDPYQGTGTAFPSPRLVPYGPILRPNYAG